MIPQRHNNNPAASSSFFSSVPELVESVRLGRPVILADDEGRENEGDLIVAADHITPELIMLMATFGRGLICVAMAPELIDRIGLPPMSAENDSKYGTAFTVSVGAREGVTTGISAQDRAHTIKTLVRPDCARDDLTTPGHVFPLRAVEGGVRVRAGHTEAAVELARLAGLTPAAVICEVLKDDGNMARMPDLCRFSQQHHVKLGTVADLVRYDQSTYGHS